jgi:sugar phosphate isomerase/epimerase
MALTTMPALGLSGAWRSGSLDAAAVRQGGAVARPNSLIGGVQIGLIAPYSFGQEATDVSNILWNLVHLGISAVELSSAAAEAFVGVPAPGTAPAPAAGRGRAGRGGAVPPATAAPAPASPAATPTPAGGRQGGGRGTLTPAELAAQRAQLAETRRARLAIPMDRYKALRTLYNNAGVSIVAFRMTLTMEMTDEEYDYAFQAAQALGANQVSMELPTDPLLFKRIGAFGEKHKLYAAYHTHLQGSMTAFDAAFAASRANMSQIDVGHYVAGTSESPIPFFQKHHARIASFHMKDRKKAGGPNMPWGQGDTPLAELLQLIRKNNWKMPAIIELEYPVPDGSTRVREIAKCLQYCKDALA